MMAYPAPTNLFPSISHPKKRALLLAYAETGQLKRSVKCARTEHSMHYYWLDTDEEYQRAFAQAKQIAAQTLEDEAIRRARDGVTRTVYHNGTPVGEQLVYSDTLLIFLLKGALPEKYGDKHEFTGKDGAPLVPSTLGLAVLLDAASQPLPASNGQRPQLPAPLPEPEP